MHVVASFSDVSFTPELLTEIEKAGVNVIPVEEHGIVKLKQALREIEYKGNRFMIVGALQMKFIKNDKKRGYW